MKIRLLGAGDEALLDHVADVFDGPVRRDMASEFLADPRHHLAVAMEGEQVVGMASALHYVHPDKRPQLFVNEVGVDPAWQRRGIGRQLMNALLDHGRTLGCTEAWVATEQDNTAARGLYLAAGGVEDPEPCIVYTFPLTASAEDTTE